MTATKRWTMLAVILGSGIVFLDSTVVNVALPKIGEDLPSRFFGVLEAQSYVYNGYLLTLSALLILAGALADYYGRKRMFLIGLIGFGTTSVLCGLAPTMELLILFRILQGAAGAILVPGSLALISAAFDGEEQGRAYGIWAGASAATTILGPFVGGLLVDSISWRAAFLINVPLVILAAYATIRHVEESKDEEASSHFDWLGATVVALAVGGLAFGTIRGQQEEWHGAVAYVSLAIGVAATIWFPFLMRRREHPLVPLQLFRSRNFTVTNISTLVIYGALYVTFYYLTIFMQGTIGYNAAAAGIAGVPGSLFLALFSSRFGSLAARYGPRIFMTAGPILMALGVLWWTRIPSGSDPWMFGTTGSGTVLPPADYYVDLLPGYILFGIGIMILVAPLTTALMTSIPKRNAGIGSAINNAISRVGPQLAGALIFVAIAATFYAGLHARVPTLNVSSSQVRQELPPLNQPASSVPSNVEQAAKEASTHSFHVAMGLAAGLLIVGSGVNWFGIRNRGGGPLEAGLEEAPEPAQAPGG